MANLADPHALMIRQIETISPLDEDDRLALKRLPVRVRVVRENRDLFREGVASGECCLILSGVACGYKIVGAGQRQIVSLHFAGDMPDLHSLLLDKVDYNLAVLSRTEVAFVPREALRALCAMRPAVAEAFYRQAMVDASILREWIANVGRRLALERVAHLICECFARMHAVGLVDDATFQLPITQSDLGDATGLSNVHINRTMQSLRKGGLLMSRGKVHTIPNWTRLREAADFNPSYLYFLPGLPA